MSRELRAQSTEHGEAAPTELQLRSGRSFRNLKVWQRAIDLATVVYKLTADFPRTEVYGLSSQLRRASVSIASNIAEGYGRASKGEFRQFVGVARGSVLELQTQLVIARTLEFGKESLLVTAENLADEVGKMTWALMQKL